MPKLRLTLATALAALAVGACSRDEVRTYRVPKEKDPALPFAAGATPPAADAAGASVAPATAPADMAATAVPVAEGDGLAWDAPAGWAPGPAAPMRKATYRITGPGGPAELSITAFPRDVGGELANLNRWRGQLHLGELDAAAMEAQVTRRAGHGLESASVDFAATTGGTRLLGAIVPYAGSTWFFKLTGPAATVGAEQASFQQFLGTVRPAAPGSP